MPYITQGRRVELTPGTAAQNGGELNYLFSTLILESDDLSGMRTEMSKVIRDYIEFKGGLKYSHANDVMGALTGAKLEMNRRRGDKKYDAIFNDVLDAFYYNEVAPYEDTKIAENGDLRYERNAA